MYDSSNFIVNIIKSNRKSYLVKINNKSEVELRVPLHFKDKDYNSIIEKHKNWIIKHLKEKLDSQNEYYDDIISYKKIYLFGELFNIHQKNDLKNYKNYRIENKVEIKNIYISSHKNINNCIKYLMKSEFLKYINNNLVTNEFYSKFKYNNIKLSNAKKRWGSCSTKGTINLSWRLAMAPINVINSVFIHELVHTIEFNHSKRFYELIDKYDIHSKESNLWLKKNSFILTLYSE